MKKSLAILALVIVAGLVGAVLFYGNDYKHDDRPVILDLKKHNEVMNTEALVSVCNTFMVPTSFNTASAS